MPRASEVMQDTVEFATSNPPTAGRIVIGLLFLYLTSVGWVSMRALDQITGNTTAIGELKVEDAATQAEVKALSRQLDRIENKLDQALRPARRTGGR